jgi:hypothetical protein
MNVMRTDIVLMRGGDVLDPTWPGLLLSPPPEIVHEDLKMGSDGESDQASATSSDEVQSPVRVRMRNHPPRKISTEVLNPPTLGDGGAGKGSWVWRGRVHVPAFPLSYLLGHQ